MNTNWRISTVNGVLLAAYFVPAWTLVAFKIMISPIHGLFDRPSISVALYVSDHLQLATLSTIRFAWLLAIGKLTVVAFLAVFVALTTRTSTRVSGDCDEALWLGLAIGGLFSFISMLMASQVGELAAMRLHAAELLLMLGGMVILSIDRPTHAPDMPALKLQPPSLPNS